MHIHFLDPYQEGESVIHRLDPRVKLVLTVVFILTTALTPVGVWPVYILLYAIIVSAAILSGVGYLFILKRTAFAIPFVLAALPLIFTTPGITLISLDLGAWELTASLTGIERFLSIAIKSLISVQSAILLTATTPFPDLLIAMRAVRVPSLLVAIFGLMWRYLFVLVDEALRLMRARAARSGVSEDADLKAGGNLAWRGKIAGGMAGSLFMRSLERSDRIYIAMLSRGYDGDVRHMPLPGIEKSNWFVLAGGIVVLGILAGLSLLIGG